MDKVLKGGRLLKNTDYHQDVEKIFNLLSIDGEYKLIGSANDEKQLYYSDYDLQENWQGKNTEATIHKLLKIFQDKFKEAKKLKDVWITDFKCGELDDEPIRWNYNTIMKGKQKIREREVSFEDCLLMKSTIKMDILALIGGLFHEFSENYYIKIGTHTNYPKLTTKDIIDSLTQDMNEKRQEGNYFKALKRKYQILKLTPHTQKAQAKLRELFNSPIGLLNSYVSDTKTYDMNSLNVTNGEKNDRNKSNSTNIDNIDHNSSISSSKSSSASVLSKLIDSQP